AAVAEVDAHEPGQRPQLVAQPLEARVVEHRNRYDAEAAMLRRRRLVALRGGEQRGQLDPGRRHLATDRVELLDGPVAGVAPEDRVGVAEDAEQCAATAAIPCCSLDQAGDLDELD